MMSMGESGKMCRNDANFLFWNRAGITSLTQMPLQPIIQNDWQMIGTLTGKAAAVQFFITRIFSFPPTPPEREFDRRWCGWGASWICPEPAPLHNFRPADFSWPMLNVAQEHRQIEVCWAKTKGESVE
ncbi:MAG: hypothetical protein U0Y68_17210 [Blastocatellia bacterium]